MRGRRVILALLAAGAITLVLAWPRASAGAGAEQSPAVRTAGWPQWGGPGRDFHVDVRLADSWQARPPRILWERPLGNGHSAFVVDERAAYTMYGGAKKEAVVALDLDTGETLWEVGYDVGYASHMVEYDGPHATPVLSGERLYTVGIDATVHALDKRTGEIVWRRRLVAEEGVDLPQSGYASSPLVWRGLLLLPGLGGEGPGALALAIADGRTVWARHDFRSSHASPILLTLAGRETTVFHGMDWIYALDPATGDVSWRHQVRRGAYDNVHFTPIWDAEGGQLLVSHGFDPNGARGLALTPGEKGVTVEQTWSNGRLQVRHTNAVLADGVLYGSNGGGGILAAVRVDDGSLLWRWRTTKANLIATRDKLLILDEQGELHLTRPTAEGLEVLGSLELLRYNAWTAPSLVGRKLYLRDRSRAVALELP